MTKPVSTSKEVTIYLPRQKGAPEPLHLLLPASPDMYDMSLRQALFGQLPYWGLRRTLDAYRRAVESGVDVLSAITAFYKAQEALDTAKMRWEHRAAIREAEELKIRSEVAEARARHARAETERNEAQIAFAVSQSRLANFEDYIALDQAGREIQKAEVETRRVQATIELAETKREAALAEDRFKATGDYKAIEKAQRASQRAEAERQQELADQKLSDARAGAGGTSFREQRKQLEQAKKDYDLLQADKAKDIERYGSFEAMPEFLQTWYEQMEDALVQQKD